MQSYVTSANHCSNVPFSVACLDFVRHFPFRSYPVADVVTSHSHHINWMTVAVFLHGFGSFPDVG